MTPNAEAPASLRHLCPASGSFSRCHVLVCFTSAPALPYKASGVSCKLLPALLLVVELPGRSAFTRGMPAAQEPALQATVELQGRQARRAAALRPLRHRPRRRRCILGVIAHRVDTGSRAGACLCFGRTCSSLPPGQEGEGLRDCVELAVTCRKVAVLTRFISAAAAAELPSQALLRYSLVCEVEPAARLLEVRSI